MKVLALILLVLAISCSGEGIDGRYIREGQPEDYFQLRPDKTFVSRQEGLTVAGTYRIDGDEITMILPSGVANVVIIESDGNVMIDAEEDRWVKEGTLHDRHRQYELSKEMSLTEEDSNENWTVTPWGEHKFVPMFDCPSLRFGNEDEFFDGLVSTLKPSPSIRTFGGVESVIKSLTREIPVPPHNVSLTASVRVLPEIATGNVAFSCLVDSGRNFMQRQHEAATLRGDSASIVDEGTGVGTRGRLLGIEYDGCDFCSLHYLYFVEGNTVAAILGHPGSKREDVQQWANYLQAKIKQVQESSLR